jgi:hypothetical protein
MRSLVKPQPVQLSTSSIEQEAAPEQEVEVRAEGSEPERASATNKVSAPRPASEAADHERTEAGDSEDAAVLSVKRLVVTDRIEGREPGANKELRADGSEVFAFVELTNTAGEPQKIEIVFEHESGQQVGFVKLPVPKDKSRWRTWGKTRQIKTAGQWVAKVRDESGAELMSRPFVVQG